MTLQVSISHQPTLIVLGEVNNLSLPLYLVGGAVRDLLLYGQVQDVDAIAPGDAREAAQLLAAQLGGTCFQMHDDPLTLRVVAGDPSLPHVDLVQIEGEGALSEIVARDLLRRDFTVNAMAGKLLSLEEGIASLELVDPCQGQKDLLARVIRPVSEAAFAEDPVRMVRCLRLAATLGFAISPETLKGIRGNDDLIANSAPERIRDELLLLLDVTPCFRHVELALDTGLLYRIIPELQDMEGVGQNGYHHLDVFEHTLETLRQLEQLLGGSGGKSGGWLREDLLGKAVSHLSESVQPGVTRRALLKLAALLHDVGKPQTRSVEAGGRVRFIGHNLLGAEMAREAGRRLRLGKRATEMVAKMVREHMRPGVLAADASPTDRALNRFLSQMADLTIEVLLLELADRLATRGPAPGRLSLERHARFMESLLQTHLERLGQAGPAKLVDGHEVMARFHIRPGPLVGQLLGLVAEAQQEGRIATKDEALSLLDEVFPSPGVGVEGQGFDGS